MNPAGFIKIHRQILDWGWYRDINTKVLFFHILLKANFKPGEWLGFEILPGQFVTGRHKLSAETGLSERQIRTAIQRLKDTSEISVKTTSKFSIITVCKWEDYQLINNQSDQQTTSKRPANDQQTTTIEEGKKEKNNKYEIFYELELQKSENDPDYKKFIEILFGENSLDQKLITLLSLPQQLSFKQFKRLMFFKSRYNINVTQLLEAMENNKKTKERTSLWLTFQTYMKTRYPETK